MTRMIEAGEDPRFVLRRMVIFAAEDVGNADPQALVVAVAALQAFELVGLPEGVLPMTQAVTYLALAPKSNRALTAYAAARKLVREHGALPVPARYRARLDRPRSRAGPRPGLQVSARLRGQLRRRGLPARRARRASASTSRATPASRPSSPRGSPRSTRRSAIASADSGRRRRARGPSRNRRRCRCAGDAGWHAGVRELGSAVAEDAQGHGRPWRDRRAVGGTSVGVTSKGQRISPATVPFATRSHSPAAARARRRSTRGRPSRVVRVAVICWPTIGARLLSKASKNSATCGARIAGLAVGKPPG